MWDSSMTENACIVTVPEKGRAEKDARAYNNQPYCGVVSNSNRCGGPTTKRGVEPAFAGWGARHVPPVYTTLGRVVVVQSRLRGLHWNRLVLLYRSAASDPRGETSLSSYDRKSARMPNSSPPSQSPGTPRDAPGEAVPRVDVSRVELRPGRQNGTKSSFT
ncbi:hypothetical protein THAOC_20259 [Thalassiosira oceanica]|uniref:Uncharacterized protein n=1 Tax=Thalassiosira oceanica TaxID=159749 RepID=K0S2P5_THAOC|nr:hypothetical protein THAOC_20259 [Thalassiosira oceanica]|eukprot:EJK59505.1 hypothetical protein THAOC_20259 [Thalassiosira oceanica]